MEEQNQREEAAAFNMALATLQRINEILKDITEMSILEGGLNPANNLYSKYKLTKQLYLASVPLISDERAKEKIKEKIKKVDEMFFMSTNKVANTSRLSFYKGTDEAIDNLIEDIQNILQNEKYFMPPKNDPKFSWKRE